MKPSKVGRGGSPGGGASGAGGAGAPTSPLTTTTTGPGTGSMKGTCSICGDRATKVAVIIQLLFKNMPRIVAVPIQPLFHNLLFLLSGVLQTISGSWKAHQFLMQVFNKILNQKKSGDIFISNRMVASCSITKANRKKCQACRCHLVTCRDEFTEYQVCQMQKDGHDPHWP